MADVGEGEADPLGEFGDSEFGAVVPAPELVERLRRHFSTITGSELGPDDDYFALGLVNSLRAMEIVAYLERTFEFEVDIEDLDLANFRTVHRAAAFIARKCAAGVATNGVR
ncbi:acyl carrier protein [Nocardia sp. NPDC057668]|uniref:acyl carrier protein n=1 Tax=Nocardia sp. NPDC057668 TaxID=3346202 RepID=UPI003670B923